MYALVYGGVTACENEGVCTCVDMCACSNEVTVHYIVVRGLIESERYLM